jgi:predicted amidohydrolase YtcJ
MKKLMFLIVLFSIIGILVGCGQKTADLVLFNGKVVTVDENMPEAQAIAVKGDRILAVGSNEAIKAYNGPSTQEIDLNGKLAIPGIIEGHGHFSSLGQALMRLNFMKVKNFDEIIAMVQEAAEKAKPGEWILGRGWHQEKWDEIPDLNVDGIPLHHDLSRVAPNNPVWLDHASGHSAMANAKAMELAGITKDTPNPPGGEIVKDSKGNPIGYFRETAQDLIETVLRDYVHNRTTAQIEAENIKATELAIQECLQNGITSFHDAGSSFETIDFFKQLADQGRLKIRLYVMINEDNEQLEQRISDYKLIGYANHHITVRSVKRLIDGALGAHGAWLLEPYEDLNSVGLNTCPIDVMKESARIAIEHDFQLCTHAIGDRGNRETLDIYEEAFKTQPQQNDFRWRIEHSQHLHPTDIPRFGDLGVIAAMQGIHCTSDGPWVYKRLGKQRAEEGAYVWQKLMATGAVVTNGTDCPVEDINPIVCYHATVTRKLKDGSVFYPDQRMSRMEALKSYTINNAYAAFEEDIKGSLTPGKLADITVLSHDILTVPEDEILNTEVLYTIVAGNVEYEK